MIQRAPRWMWLALGAIASVLTAIGIALALPSGDENGAQVTWVTLRGFDECSEIVDLDQGPSGENFFGLYLAGTQIRFLDQEDYTVLLDGLPDSPITASGNVCFLGLAGERVRVRQVPD